MAHSGIYNRSPLEHRLSAPLPPLPYADSNDKTLPDIRRDSPSSVQDIDWDGFPSTRYAPHSYSGATPSPYRTDERDPFTDAAAIPLQNQYSKADGRLPFPPSDQEVYDTDQPSRQRPTHRSREKRKKRARFSRHSPWFIYTISIIQIIVFIAEIVRNGQLTGSPIEIHPSFNPMIGPSPYVLINMGARYVSCMRNMQGVQNSNTSILWPCPNQTSDNPTCTLSELCGFSGVPNPKVGGSLNDVPAPNQWFRFIVPIFLHAGIIHISFNLILQLLLGGDMERIIGPVRMVVVYFSSGIFGFVLGGNFAASGIESCGASGAIFGLIALNLLDILYTWQTRPKPWRDLAFIFLDIVVSFVLGLLPGLDNFSHIGGFLMGLVLGICLLRSPAPLRRRTGSLTLNDDKTAIASGAILNESCTTLVQKDDYRTRDYPISTTNVPSDKAFHTQVSSTMMFRSPKKFFSNRMPLWWAWWCLRAGALVGVIIVFIVLIHSFYSHHDTQCPSCKYLSCLPVSDWCEVGSLTFNNPSTSSPAA